MFARLLLVTLALVVLWAVVARESSGSGPERAYIVRAHDTLWAIAERSYGGDPREGIWKIQDRNDLDGAVLRPGQRLMLPP
jgi:hypothetical protein